MATGTARASRDEHVAADLAQVHLQAEGEEEDGRREVAQAQELLLDLVAHLAAGQQDPGEQRPDRLREPGGLPDRGPAQRQGQPRQQDLLAIEAGDDAVDGVVRPAAHQQERQHEEQGQARGDGDLAAAHRVAAGERRGDPQEHGDRQVLEHEHAQHEVGLVVAQALHVEQGPGHDAAART